MKNAIEKKILIIVDMQNDFIDGALGTKEAAAIVPGMIEHIRALKKDGYEMIATLDTHQEDYLNTPEGKKLPVPHCIKDTEGWKINPDILEAMGECILLEKPTFGSVKLPGLVAELAKDADRLTIQLMGVCTDICVVSNALLLKAHFTDATIQVKADLCAGVTPEKHAAALETMASCQIDIV